MDVTLAQLEALRQVVATGSFSRAARALRVTQPAVSQQIAALQRSLGVKLVEIVRNRPALTDAGRFVAERADVVGRHMDVLLRETADYRNAERGSLQLAATLTIGNYVLPSVLAKFLSVRPHVVPRVDVVNTAAVARALNDGVVHLGLIEGNLQDDAFETCAFARDRMVLIVPAHGHRLSRVESIRAEALHDQPFVSREPGSGTRDLGYELLLGRGVRPKLVLELPGGEAILRAVEAGLGVAILSERVVDRALALKTVRSVRIADLELERAFTLVHLRDRTLPPLARAFGEFLCADQERPLQFAASQGRQEEEVGGANVARRRSGRRAGVSVSPHD